MMYINEPAEAQKEERTEDSESSVNQKVAGLIPQTDHHLCKSKYPWSKPQLAACVEGESAVKRIEWSVAGESTKESPIYSNWMCNNANRYLSFRTTDYTSLFSWYGSC